MAAVAALDFIDDDHKMLRGSPATAVSKLHRFYQVSSLIDTALYSCDETDLIANAKYEHFTVMCNHSINNL